MGDRKHATWTKIAAGNMEAFLGFSILMGIVHMPFLNDYWKRDPLLHYTPIADRISRDRFRELSRYLRFVDNATLVYRDSPGYDRLGKVRPILSTKFAELYNPHKEVAMDEAMIKFQGRSSLKRYMPLNQSSAESRCGFWQTAEMDTFQRSILARVLRQRRALVCAWLRHLHLNWRGRTTTSSLTISSPAMTCLQICVVFRKGHRCNVPIPLEDAVSFPQHHSQAFLQLQS